MKYKVKVYKGPLLEKGKNIPIYDEFVTQYTPAIVATFISKMLKLEPFSWIGNVENKWYYCNKEYAMQMKEIE